MNFGQSSLFSNCSVILSLMMFIERSNIVVAIFKSRFNILSTKVLRNPKCKKKMIQNDDDDKNKRILNKKQYKMTAERDGKSDKQKIEFIEISV